MITPQEAESHVFSKASFGSGGYNMAQVDTFLDALIADYAALYKETATLKGKMKVLVDKIEEYRSTEDAMRMTLLNAQKMADNMVKEGEAKREEAISKAAVESKSKIEQIRRELANEELRLTAARNSTAAYVNRLKDLYARELEYIGNLSELVSTSGGAEEIAQIAELTSPEPPEQESPAPPAVEEAPPVTEMPDMTRLFAPVEEKPEAEEVKAEEPEAGDETLVFDRLEFGKDYDFE